ncbi:MAG: GH116 family glycosyl hydrolase [Deltaproteobacteria bacterium]|nr:GH116 family glycosyl hydrolase [Deltaproteobacteria bacterium]
MKRRDLLAGAGLGAAGSLLLSPTRQAEAARRLPPAYKEVMRNADKARNGVTLGGVGSGGAELRKDGRFYNWSAFNNAPRGTGEPLPEEQADFMFFKLRYEVPGQEPRIKLLQIEDGYRVGTVEVHVYEFPWMTGVEKIEYSARFPNAELVFTDPEMPVEVRMKAWSPFIPHDVDSSNLPALCFDFQIVNKSNTPVDVMLIACQRNLAGYDFKEKFYTANVSEGQGHKMFEAGAREVPADRSSAGTLALASLSSDSSHYLGWEHRHPYFERVLRGKTLGNIDETEKRTTRDRKTNKRWALPRTFNSLAKSANLKPKQSFDHSFVMTWHFPNMWNESKTRIEGAYYARKFKSAAEVAKHVVANRDDLHKRTNAFIENFYDSDAEPFVLDQINSQLNTFITSGWCTKDGNFGILEGITSDHHWGPIATTDVSVYGSVPIATMFPSLQRQTLRAHRAIQQDSGEVAHGLQRDFGKRLTGVAGVDRRLDLHAQYVGMVMRDFFWTGDKDFLKEMWPSLKKAIEYCVKERDLNGDSMPDMEGIMSSYDNFPMYGVAAYIGSQWLAALAGMVEGAKALGDADAQKRYAGFYDKGKAIFEERLWNGKYYRLWNDEGGKHGGKDEGCLTDQLIGQWTMRFNGLGDLVPREHITSALKSVLDMSYKPKFGLRNCSWPGATPWADVPDNIWVDQANTCWSGVELAFASFLMYEGLYKQGVDVMRTVDDRYRKVGRYWDHQEFGGHYYRALAAWAAVNAMAGLSQNQGVYGFAPTVPKKQLKLFFAVPTATGHYERTGAGGGQRVSLKLATGSMTISGLKLAIDKPSAKTTVWVDGKPVAAQAAVSDNKQEVWLTFATPLVLNAGQVLQARA